jgi:hypothetical protein
MKKASGTGFEEEVEQERRKAPRRKTPPIPAGYHTVTPYLVCRGAAGAIDFYKRAFGAREKMRMPGPDGRVAHAEIQIGDSRVMLGEEMPEMGAKSPEMLGGSEYVAVRRETGEVRFLGRLGEWFTQSVGG